MGLTGRDEVIEAVAARLPGAVTRARASNVLRALDEAGYVVVRADDLPLPGVTRRAFHYQARELEIAPDDAEYWEAVAIAADEQLRGAVRFTELERDALLDLVEAIATDGLDTYGLSGKEQAAVGRALAKLGGRQATAGELARNVPGSDEKEEVVRLREQVHGAVEALRAIVAEPNPGGAVAADAMRMIAQTELRRIGGQ
jgi:hypothetical protein